MFLVFFRPVRRLGFFRWPPGAFPSFAPSFLVRSLPSTLFSAIVLHFSFLGVPFPLLLFSLLACGQRLPRCMVSASVFCLHLLYPVRCSYPAGASSFGSSQLRLFLRRVAGFPAAPVVPPPLRFPWCHWSSTSPVPLLRLRWSLLPFFSASLVLARFFRSFPALFVERFCGCLFRLLVLSCCFVSCGCLLFLGVLFGVLAIPLSYCLVLPGLLPSFALFLGLRSLSRSFRFLVLCWRFFGPSGSHLPWVFPLCVFLPYFPVVSDLIGSPVPFATWSPFGSSQVLLLFWFLSLLGFLLVFLFLWCGFVVFL